jgi:leader peptidase (prepilin peptidase)/N-methyltransferase
MIAGAEIDARTYLLPNAVTLGATVSGLVLAPFLDPVQPWLATGEAAIRALFTALVLECVRLGYAWIRQQVGLGFGDVKLAMAVGAWLPIDSISLCFGAAATAALVSVLITQLRGKRITGTTRIPFGAFICPALWVVFYLGVVPL